MTKTKKPHRAWTLYRATTTSGNHIGCNWSGRTSNYLFNTVRVLKLAAMVLVACTLSLRAAPVGVQVNPLGLRPPALSPKFNKPGNILIADQFNNRVIEIETNGNIVWQFGLGPNDFSPKSIVGCNDAQRVGPFTLMAGTGTPPAVVTNTLGGTADNRVILVDPYGRIVWQYGQFGVTGSGPNELNVPVQCTWLPSFHVLITDQANNRIIEVNLQKQIVWSYPGNNTNPSDQLNNPNSAELLENGHVLISDENNSRALEVTHDNNDQIVQTLTAGGTLNILAFSSRLENGDTLLTDSGNARIVEVDSNDVPVWTYQIDTNPPSVQFPLPTRAVRLADGNTLVSDQFNNRVFLVNQAGTAIVPPVYGLPLGGGGTIAPGPVGVNIGYDLHTTQNGLYAPYDAKVVGDYTGLTPPFDFDGDADDTHQPNQVDQTRPSVGSMNQ